MTWEPPDFLAFCVHLNKIKQKKNQIYRGFQRNEINANFYSKLNKLKLNLKTWTLLQYRPKNQKNLFYKKYRKRPCIS